jgi:hypothetical protein
LDPIIGSVTDLLSSAQPGPEFRVRTTNAAGKPLLITSTNNTAQLFDGIDFGPLPPGSDTRLLTGFLLSTTGDSMNFGLARGARGLLTRDPLHRPTSETLTVTAREEDGWIPKTLTVPYTILNDSFKASLNIDSRTVLEGQPITGALVATDLFNGENRPWRWEVDINDFTVGSDPLTADFAISDAAINYVIQGSGTTARYVANFSIPTVKNPTTPTTGTQRITKSQGTLNIRNPMGQLFASREITIQQWATTAPPPSPSPTVTYTPSYTDARFITVDRNLQNVSIATRFFGNGTATSAAPTWAGGVRSFTWTDLVISNDQIADWNISIGNPSITIFGPIIPGLYSVTTDNTLKNVILTFLPGQVDIRTTIQAVTVVTFTNTKLNTSGQIILTQLITKDPATPPFSIQ